MSFLTKKIFGSSKSAFGLDLSDLSVKIIELKRSGTEQCVRSFGAYPIAAGSVSNGEIINMPNVISAVKQTLQHCNPKKISTKRVICSLPETKAFLRIINLPKMNKDEVSEAIKWEMEANIPLSIDQVYYDWQVLEKNFSGDENKMSLLVVAVSQKTVNDFLSVLTNAGLEAVGMEIESIAQARSLVAENSKETTMIIDIGDRRTSFLMVVEGTPCFTSSIPLSSGSLTDNISKAMNLSFAQAEKIKLTYGIGSFTQQDALFKAVEPVLENFVSEIERTIDFYLTGMKYSASIDKIIVCGGGANCRGIVPYLSGKLNREVELGNTWINCGGARAIPVIPRDESIQYSTAVGLALKSDYLAQKEIF